MASKSKPVYPSAQFTFEVELERDKDIPHAKRPRLKYRSLNGREQCDILNIQESYENNASVADAVRKMWDAVRTGLVSWENQVNRADGKPVKFDPKNIDLILNIKDIHEVLQKVLMDGQVSAEDAKK